MKRLHVHVAVEDMTASIRFYSRLFAAEPVVLKGDYAKWMLDEPRVNFAISRRGAPPGIRHLGIQVESHPELEEVYGRLRSAERPVFEEGRTTCCYALSEKSWIEDPQGIRWETFLTTGESTTYGADPEFDEPLREEPSEESTVCCAPTCCAPRSAFVGIALPNPASVALHESLGFVPVGVYRDVGYKLGRWHAVSWWRLGLATGDAPPGEIVPFARLKELPTREREGAP